MEAPAPTDLHFSTVHYNANKVRIRKQLCNHDDLNTVLISPGSFAPDMVARATNERLQALASQGIHATLVRGFRMIAMTAHPDPSTFCYCAQGTVAIRHPDGRFESLCQNATTAPTKPFVFVPSTRMHKDLTDEQLLSGYFLLCSIVCGPQTIVDAVLNLKDTMNFHDQRRFCRTPEECTARRSLAIRQFPGYAQWASKYSQIPKTMYVDSTLAFGFPYRDLTDAEMEELFAGKDVRMAICSETKHDFLCPNPPWSYATSLWLPSTPVLHDYLAGTFDVWQNTEAMLADEGVSDTLLSLYETLEREYVARLRAGERRAKNETNLGPFR